MSNTKQDLQYQLKYASAMAESYAADYEKWSAEVKRLNELLEQQHKAECKDKTASPADIGKTALTINIPKECKQPMKYTEWEYKHFWKAHVDKVIEECAMENSVTVTHIRKQIEKLGMGYAHVGKQNPVSKFVSDRLIRLCEIGVLANTARNVFKKIKKYKSGGLEITIAELKKEKKAQRKKEARTPQALQ